MDAFVSYGYTPFRKGQCVKRILFLWALSAGVCFIGERRVWAVGLAAGAVCVSVFFAVLETGDSWMMAVGFLLLLFGCVLAFLFITFRNIKKGVFSKEPTAKQTAILPAAGGAVGVLAARFLLTGQPQQTVFRLTGALLLILSLLISIPGINILKAVLCKE